VGDGWSCRSDRLHGVDQRDNQSGISDVGLVKLQGVGVGSRKHMTDLLNFLEQYRITPVIDASYHLSDLPLALDHLDRGPFGKIVVEVR